MGRIEQTSSRRSPPPKRKALVAYLCVGDPSVDESIDLALACVEAGADILELGVPFSDPTADGPAIARASQRAIAHGGGLSATLRAAKATRARTTVLHRSSSATTTRSSSAGTPARCATPPRRASTRCSWSICRTTKGPSFALAAALEGDRDHSARGADQLDRRRRESRRSADTRAQGALPVYYVSAWSRGDGVASRAARSGERGGGRREARDRGARSWSASASTRPPRRVTQRSTWTASWSGTAGIVTAGIENGADVSARKAAVSGLVRSCRSALDG